MKERVLPMVGSEQPAKGMDDLPQPCRQLAMLLAGAPGAGGAQGGSRERVQEASMASAHGGQVVWWLGSRIYPFQRHSAVLLYDPAQHRAGGARRVLEAGVRSQV